MNKITIPFCKITIYPDKPAYFTQIPFAGNQEVYIFVENKEIRNKTTHMETEAKSPSERKTHHGHAVKRLRRDLGLSQEQLGKQIGMSQQTVCRNEEQKTIDDDTLERLAKGLGVSVDFIKNMEDEKPLVQYFQHNTYNVSGDARHNNMGSSMGETETVNHYYGLDDTTLLKIFNSIEDLCRKNLSQCAEFINLYSQLMKTCQETIRNLENKQ